MDHSFDTSPNGHHFPTQKEQTGLKAPTLVDIFCGAGGLSLGFTWAGFMPLLAIDKVKDCAETYAYNHPFTKVITGDVTQVSNERIIEEISQRYGITSVDVVAGGPPCESFSTAGPTTRKSGDIRDILFENVIRIGKALNAKYLLIENVPAIQSKKSEDGVKGDIFEELQKTLRRYGYGKFEYKVLNAADFGVPQIRQRLFIIATSDINLPIKFPEPTHSKTSTLWSDGYPQWITVEDAFSDLPNPSHREREDEPVSKYTSMPNNNYQCLMHGIPSEEFPVSTDTLLSGGNNQVELTYHWAPNHRASTIERISMIRQGEGLRDLWMRLDPEERKKLQQRKVLPAKWYIQRYQRPFPHEPSFTVTSHCLDEITHPFENRQITVREAARLQSFPDSYQFVGGKWINPHGYEPQDKYEQVGDSVPPLLAWNLARSLYSGLKSKSESIVQQSLEAV